MDITPNDADDRNHKENGKPDYSFSCWYPDFSPHSFYYFYRVHRQGKISKDEAIRIALSDTRTIQAINNSDFKSLKSAQRTWESDLRTPSIRHTLNSVHLTSVTQWICGSAAMHGWMLTTVASRIPGLRATVTHVLNNIKSIIFMGEKWNKNSGSW